MKLTIELESLDDLINLIGLARCVEPKEPKKEQPSIPVPTSNDVIRKADDLIARMEKRKVEQDERRWMFLNQPIEYMSLAPSVINSLKLNRVFFVKDLWKYSQQELLRFPFVGKMSVQKMSEHFRNHGITLKVKHDGE